MMRTHFLLLLSFCFLLGCNNNSKETSGNQKNNNLSATHLPFAKPVSIENQSADNCDLPQWESVNAYTKAGTKVVYKGKIYTNKWYAKGHNPEDEGDQNPWKLVAFCTAEHLNCKTISDWSSQETYNKKGTQVLFNNDLYINKWYTKGDTPDSSDVWKYKGPCGGSAVITIHKKIDTLNTIQDLTTPPTNLPKNTSGKYTYGILPQNIDHSIINTSFNNWKEKFVTDNGCPNGKRVLFDDMKHTVSEGIGYGILIAAYMKDEQLVDDLLAYYQSFLNENGLMHWKTNNHGQIVGRNAATDADEDVAFGLLVAHENINAQKGYKEEANRIINQIMKTMVEENTYVLKPGDQWGGSNTTNPSYFAPAYFKVFAQSTGDQKWIKVSDKSYKILFSCMNQTTGLVPDWCKADGSTPADEVNWSKDNGATYNYDAARTPWRIGLDALWFGDTRGSKYCHTIASFIKKTGISNIKDAYNLDGKAKGSNHTSTFIGPFGVGIMGTDANYQSTLDLCYKENITTKNSNYFNSTIRLLTLMTQNGLFTLPEVYKK